MQQGKVLYVGSSNFAGWHIAQANEAAKRRNFLGLVSEQSIYHLLNRKIELEVIPACGAYGVGVIPWSPLGGGLLGGVTGKGRTGPARGRRRAEAAGKEPRQDRGVGEPVPRTGRKARRCGDCLDAAEQARSRRPSSARAPWSNWKASSRSLEIKLSDETNKKLNEIFPGKKTAPEDYAW